MQVVTCPVEGCNRTSTTFDPAMYLSVPLPTASDKNIEVRRTKETGHSGEAASTIVKCSAKHGKGKERLMHYCMYCIGQVRACSFNACGAIKHLLTPKTLFASSVLFGYDQIRDSLSAAVLQLASFPRLSLLGRPWRL